jgi:N-acetylneuraminic acid mutarotase
VVFAGGKGNNWGLKTIEVYDMETNTWDSTLQLTEEIPTGAGASAGNRLLIGGGNIVDMFQLK